MLLLPLSLLLLPLLLLLYLGDLLNHNPNEKYNLYPKTRQALASLAKLDIPSGANLLSRMSLESRHINQFPPWIKA